MTARAYVFDAYGTLFDVHSVVDRCEDLFPRLGSQLSIRWRTRQLEYTWLRSLMGRYEDFWQITRDALIYSCHSLGLAHTTEQIDALMQAYLMLSPFPDVTGVLDRLSGSPCAILSNGTPEMLRHVVKNAGLESKFQHVLSVDSVKLYKPHPVVYQLAESTIGIDRREIVFVSANSWDIAGAQSFGFQGCWLNRSAEPTDRLGVQPDRVIRSALEIMDDCFANWSERRGG
jgi:2-haloacid dehalogenase